MALIPWREREGGLDPFKDMERLRSQMNNLFNMSLSKWFDPSADTLPEQGWGPAMDIYDKKDKIVVKSEIPGMKKDEIDLILEDGILTIKGEKKREEKSEEGGELRRELYYGAFQRAVALPSDVDEKKIRASYKKGVLEVELPKKESAKPKQLKIDVGE